MDTGGGVAVKIMYADAKRQASRPAAVPRASRLTCAPSTPASDQPKNLVSLPFSFSLRICGWWAWRCEHGRSWQVRDGERRNLCCRRRARASGRRRRRLQLPGTVRVQGALGGGRWGRVGRLRAGSAHRRIADHVVGADRHQDAPEERVEEHLGRVPERAEGHVVWGGSGEALVWGGGDGGGGGGGGGGRST